MVSLTFFGGVKEIGGNKILLQDRDTRVLLDFGMSFKQSGLYFSEFLGPRKCNGLGDFFTTGLLPDIPGVYRTDYLRQMGRGREDRTVDAVLLSHGHMDHAAYIHHLRPDIELVMSRETHAVLKTIQETGSGGYSEYLDLSPSFQIRPSERGGGYTRVTKREGTQPRKLRIVEPGRKTRVNGVEIVPYAVDHSLPGATAYLIHTGEGSILYTGDLRFHGYHGEETREMVEKVSGEGIDLMLVEGTRITEHQGTTETDVYRRASEIIRGTQGLAVVNYPMRDLARFKTFHNIAKATGRKLVIGFKQAYQLELFAEITGEYPGLDDPSLCLYAERKGWGTAGRSGLPSNIEGVCLPENVCQQDYDAWEREYLDRGNTVCYTDLREDQSQYIFYCNYFQVNELIDVKPVPGSVYIRSVTEPFDEEMELDARRIDNWLSLFRLTQYGRRPDDRLHASGHASGDELKEMIDEIKPKQIIPIHTEHPETMKKFHQNVVILKEKDVFTL
jgi:ribonuclease J